MVTLEQLRGDTLLGARHIKLSANLDVFPKELLKFADTLEVLDLSGNQLTSLPDEFASLQKLKILFCSDNPFKSLPTVLGRCPNLSMVGFKANQIEEVSAEALPPALRWLILTDNQLTRLPDALGERPLLQKLMLAGNHLQGLPDSLQHCHRLELLRISANRFSALPDWLFDMPKLTWLAVAGNPLNADRERLAMQHSDVPSIPWSSLTLHELLGQGASGLIYRASWRTDEGGDMPVAVKVFKSHVTSDGLPQSEMAAALRVGQHPHLTEVLGLVPDHPDRVSVLVMRLLDPHYKNLAGPPSFESCTRDVYADSARFSLSEVIGLVLGVVDATMHMHERGVMHGDLYAHNLLHDSRGRVLMGDFGAASLFDPSNAKLAASLTALDVRAIGWLLEELLDRCHALPAQLGVHKALSDWRDRCLSDAPVRRPSLVSMAEALRFMTASPVV